MCAAHETFQLEILLERLKKQLHLLAVLVDHGNGGRAKGQQIGQQHNLSLVGGIPDHHAAEHDRAIGSSFVTRESDQLIGPDIAVLRNGALRRYLVSGILLPTRDKIDFLGGPLAEQRDYTVMRFACKIAFQKERIYRSLLNSADLTTLELQRNDVPESLFNRARGLLSGRGVTFMKIELLGTLIMGVDYDADRAHFACIF